MRPILVDKCFKCHGEKKQSNGLRLDSREARTQGGRHAGRRSFPASRMRACSFRLSPRRTPSSRCRRRENCPIRPSRRSSNGLPRARPGRPPAATSRSAGAKAGPEAATHWAFQPIKPVRPPAVKNPSACAGTVDAFVVAKLEAAGMTLSPRGLEEDSDPPRDCSISGESRRRAAEVDRVRGRPIT